MKQHAFLIVLLVVVAAGAWLLWNAEIRETTRIAEPGRFVPALRDVAAEIRSARLTYPDGSEIDLSKEPDGWQVTRQSGQSMGYPADTQRLNNLLVSLARSKVLETKTSDRSRWQRLGLKPGTRIEFPDQTQLPTVHIGHYEEARQAHFAHRSDQPAAVLLDRRILLPEDPKDWVNRLLMDLSQVQIKQLTIEHQNDMPVQIRKQSPGQSHFQLQSVPAGKEPVSELIIDGLAAFWTDLRFESLSKAPVTEAAANPVVLKLTTQTFAGDQLTAEAIESNGDYWFRFRATLSDASLSGAEADAARAGLEQFNLRTRGWWFKLPAERRQAIDKTMVDLTRPDHTGG